MADHGRLSGETPKITFRDASGLAGVIAQPITEIASLVGIPGVSVALSLVGKISDVADTMHLNKKQSRRLAQSAGDIVDSVDAMIADATPDEINMTLRSNISKLVSVLQRVEQQLQRIASYGFVRRLAAYLTIQEELVDLDKDIQDAARGFMISNSISQSIQQTKIEQAMERAHRRAMERAREEDKKVFTEEVQRVTMNKDLLFERIGLHGNKVDSESTESLREILYRTDNNPTSILPVAQTFAETATKTIKSRTGRDVLRTFPWTVYPKEIERKSEVGRGGFSTVYKGHWNTHQMIVAIKVFQDSTAQNIDALFGEIFMWKHLKNEFLHPFLGAGVGEQPFIISPFCKNGNILDHLNVHPEANRLKILHDISRGMEYLHENNAVHGDLKARNVLIADDGQAVVADFGLARFEHSSDPSSRDTVSPSSGSLLQPQDLVGTLRWLAPECFFDGKLTRYTDMWAMGMTGYEIFTNGGIPLSAVEDNILGKSLLDGMRPERPVNPSVPDIGWSMMTRCWCGDPMDRPSFACLSIILGVFQSDLDSMRKVGAAFNAGSEAIAEVARWPALVEQLVAILSSNLDIIGTPSEHFSLTERAQALVISALSAIDNMAKGVETDSSVGRSIVGAGVLEVLLFILRERAGINPAILSLCCEILERLLAGWKNTTIWTDDSNGDLLQALCELVGCSEQAISVRASLAARRMIFYAPAELKLDQKNRAVQFGIIPRLVTALDSKDKGTIHEACRFVMTLGRSPTALSPEDLKVLSPSIATLICHNDAKVQTIALDVLHTLCRVKEQLVYLKNGGFMDKIISLWTEARMPSHDLNIHKLLEELALPEHIPGLLDALNLNDNHPFKFNAVNALARIGDQLPRTEEKQYLSDKHHIIHRLMLLLASSPEEPLLQATGDAIAAFSTPESPYLIRLLDGPGNLPAKIKVIAVAAYKVVVDRGTHEQNVFIAGSGTIPSFRRQLSSLMGIAVINSDMHDLRLEILHILHKIIWHLDGTNLELAIAAYINAGLLSILVDLFSDHLPDQVTGYHLKCLLILSKISRGNDEARKALAQTNIFASLHLLMGFTVQIEKDAGAIERGCEILEGVLSTENSHVNISAVISANLVERLVKCLNRPDVESTPAAKALSYLLMSQNLEIVEHLEQEGVLTKLTEYCTSANRTFALFDQRMWAIVDHLRHPSDAIQKFGIFVTGLLLTGTTNQKKSVITIAGLSEAVDYCGQRDHPKISQSAREVAAKIEAGHAAWR